MHKRKTALSFCSLKCRLLGSVKMEGSCHIWQGKRSIAGYGIIMINKKIKGAHRISYEEFIGPINSGYFVCHSCDNRPCINPKHLFQGTIQDNTRDMIQKKRNRHYTKLDDSMVLEIRKLAQEKKMKKKDMADLFKISRVTVRHIISKKIWKHI